MIMPYIPIVVFQKLCDIGWLGILEMIMSEDEPLRVGLVPLYIRTQSVFTWVRTLSDKNHEKEHSLTRNSLVP